MRNNPLSVSLERYLTEAEVNGKKTYDKTKTRFSHSHHFRDHGFKLENLSLHQTSRALP